ncbi:MAG TPA: hypothetical protein VN759_13115, partial [Pseudolysinimonas sp.]|nr:hypothetical protein [Pseudolysinimonas sp.]
MAARWQLPRLWSFLTGTWFALALGLLPIAIPHLDPIWLIALAPAAAGAGLILLAATPLPGWASRPMLLGGALAVLALASMPAAATALGQFLTLDASFIGAEPAAAAILGLAAFVLCAAVTAALPHAVGAEALVAGLRIAALWTGAIAVITIAGWTGFIDPVRAALGVVLGLATALVLLLIPAVRAAAPRWRVPLGIAGHLLLLLAAVISWPDPALVVPIGAGIVVVLIPLSMAVPAIVRPLSLAVGYAFALTVLARGLSLAHLDPVAVLCLVTTAASVFALVITLLHRVRAGLWYAVLVVTVVPFALGIASMLIVRSGWTALSTGVTFALALTLLLTRRPGLNRFVRSFAAALLVPALAAVVISAGAQLLAVSASPVTLPVIAVIVACTLPSTGIMRTSLVRRGLPAPDASAARTWIEISALVTGAVAVLLALVRSAAGVPTTFLVLLLLGIGAGAAALFAHRRYGWWVAGAAWTGALWCLLWLGGVHLAEPYILPPALAAAVIGAILVARGERAVGLYASGLACAVLPSLVILAIWGPLGWDGPLPWRSYGLLAAGAVLILLARTTLRGRLSGMRVPTLVIAIAAVAAGPVQAVRWALGADVVVVPSAELVMLPVLVISAVSVLLASLSGRALAAIPGGFARSRWLYAPAVLDAAVGPIVATRPGWFPIWTLWSLSLVLLAVMITTTLR